MSTLALAFETKSSSTSSKMLVVPYDYRTINEAVAGANDGDTVLVTSGIYAENVLVNKALTIRGADSTTTIVVGEGGLERGAKAVFTLTSSDVRVENLTIRSQTYKNTTYYASGVNVQGENCFIVGNVINSTYYGVFSSVQSNVTIASNLIMNSLKEGIRICGGSGNKITDNSIQGNAQSGIAVDGYSDLIAYNKIVKNTRGIGLGASYSLVFGNELARNSESGIFLASSESIIANNNIEQNKWGIYITTFFSAPSNNVLYHNNFVNNSQPVGTGSILNSQKWYELGEGNYWSSYTGPDDNKDGIGDAAYLVYGNDTDLYPLTHAYSNGQSSAMPTLPVQKTSLGEAEMVSLWHLDEARQNGVTPDSRGNNPIILEPVGDSYVPVLVEGVKGRAFQFNGSDYAYLTASPTLDFKSEISVDAWVRTPQFKDVDYNNIFVECMRTPDKYPTQILGFAINGRAPQNTAKIPLGALRGFFLDESGVFNEIVTTQYVVPLNQWVHVTFVRSFATGMHIYVDGVEKSVQVTSGSQNSTSSFAKGTEFYVGHDSFSTIDELSVSTVAKMPELEAPSLLSEWWFLSTIALGALFLGAVVFLIRRNGRIDRL
jgi:parallel beta-helix repeat protein